MLGAFTLPLQLTPVPIAPASMDSLQNILTKRTSTLGGLIRHAAQLKELSAHLARRLPPPLNRHVTVANVYRDTLVLNTGSPVWAARLRYLTPTILEFVRCRPGLDKVRSVRVRVAPPEAVTRPPYSRPPRHPSAASADNLRNAAAATADPALRAALLRLAGRHAQQR